MTRIVHEGDKCQNWPKCPCILQGYYNLDEPNNCGRKPKTRRRLDLDRGEYGT